MVAIEDRFPNPPLPKKLTLLVLRWIAEGYIPCPLAVTGRATGERQGERVRLQNKVLLPIGLYQRALALLRRSKVKTRQPLVVDPLGNQTSFDNLALNNELY